MIGKIMGREAGMLHGAKAPAQLLKLIKRKRVFVVLILINCSMMALLKKSLNCFKSTGITFYAC